MAIVVTCFDDDVSVSVTVIVTMIVEGRVYI
jgi:hypothetical protein